MKECESLRAKLQVVLTFPKFKELNMTATRNDNDSTRQASLYVAFELGWTEWKVAFTSGQEQKARVRTLRARDLQGLQLEIAKAKLRFGLPADAPVLSCYEAGRDGFWLHRYLTSVGVQNVIVDSASIEVNRRKRRAKSDQLDARKLLSMLLRHLGGEKKVWSVVRVPSAGAEDDRQWHRDLEELKDERTGHTNRIKGLLASHGLDLLQVNDQFPDWLKTARTWDGSAVPPELQSRLLRQYQRWQQVDRQVKDMENDRRKRIRRTETPSMNKVRLLLGLRGLGLNGSWLLVFEFFAWRQFTSGKQVGGAVGLTPTPYNSGDSKREQGISKAGSRRMRRMMVELAWCWLRWQPDSALAQWYRRRFHEGNNRARKIGVVAVARKLLIALWKYLEQGELPAGAQVVDWRTKLTSTAGKKAVA
jgi:transposase